MAVIQSKVKNIFLNAYIIGGSPCSGKSTIAEHMSKEFGMQYYKVDDHENEHSKRSNPKYHPTMYKYSQMSWNEIWNRPILDQVQELFDYYQERFEMIIEDLESYDMTKSVILEGSSFLPKLIKQYEADPSRVLFMLPTKEFQTHHYKRRKWIDEILKNCEDPEQAFTNWMIRDHKFSIEILEEAKIYNYRTILVDGSESIDENYKKVVDYFKV